MTAPRLDAHGYWVAVRCTFQCRSCGFAAPLDQLDVDGSVECAYCGLRQRFEPSTWIEALEFAHAVGDLSGPEPEGRAPNPSLWIAPDNPFRDVGETVTFSELRQSGSQMVDGMLVPRSLQIRVAPGFPVCRRCRVPVRIALGPEGATTWCGACSESATYALPERAGTWGPGLVAVVAEEHRLSRARATESPGDGTNVSAVSCPSCGAPLDLRGGDRTLKCQFCSTFCRVPGRFLLRQGQATIEPEIWWLLFNGPSKKRRALEGGAGVGKSKELELPPFEGGLNYKQWIVNVAFVLGALWLGFEVASLDALQGFTVPAQTTASPAPPAAPSPPPRAPTTVRAHTK